MFKKSIYYLAILFSSVFFLSCSEEDPNPEELEVDFEITLDKETAPAQVTITNNTTGATSYEWDFTGGDPVSSTKQNPETITYSEAGDYTIILDASNGSGSKKVSKNFSLSAALTADFEISLSSESAPAEVNITNNSTGASTYNWTFEGADPANSTEETPAAIYYANKGEYTINLEVSNGTDTETLSKTFSLSEQLTADFEISVNSDQAPAEVTITNNSTGATSYNWTFTGGDPASSTNENPSVVNYAENGEYTIELAVSNGTETISNTKVFTLQTTEITTYQNITLGGVDVESTVGSVFSTTSGTVIKSGNITAENGASIDIPFIQISGLRFFETPQDVSGWGLTEIPNATETKFINYMESSSINFTVETFDAMTDDSSLRDLTIEADNESFPTGGLPRIVLFENAQGKKGAIKITDIVSGPSGSITFDLKVQK
ncbi:hypothetical protein GCM10027429_16680 [Marivirga atlantica]|jgi:PKD repeat protein|uniref:PKD domain-containing protein n=1 Tax=Marivirga atlantica TaxID=1548457 RepID=A0A937AEL5_9BACT|nr:PKD domain-containing protein [Marivirga atlantica]MBL0765286.1 PKD domain-containing protein [Marivirga atlantica]